MPFCSVQKHEWLEIISGVNFGIGLLGAGILQTAFYLGKGEWQMAKWIGNLCGLYEIRSWAVNCFKLEQKGYKEEVVYIQPLALWHGRRIT